MQCCLNAKHVSSCTGVYPPSNRGLTRSLLQYLPNKVLLFADHAGYGPVYCLIIKYYSECLTALDICNQEAVRLFTSTLDAPVDPKRLLQLLKEAAVCLMRCWSMVRSKDGTSHFFLLTEVSFQGGQLDRVKNYYT
jgi:hypothetical protein